MQNLQSLQSLSKGQIVSSEQRLSSYITGLSGLIAYYPLNETSGDAINRAPDTFGTLNGTVTGATQGVAGQVGNAYSFDGTNDFVSIADNNIFDALPEVTVFVMLKMGTSSAFEKVIFKNAVFDIGVNDSGVIFGELNSVSNPGGWGDTEIDDDEWHMCAITYDGVEIVCYVDGDPVESLGGLSGSLGTGGAALELGRHADNLNEYYSGSMQHFAIYNTALSPAQISNISELFF